METANRLCSAERGSATLLNFSALIVLHIALRQWADEALQQRLWPLFFSQATSADHDIGRIASLGEGPHIAQHVSALFLREADIPRRHIRFAVMDSLEQVGIGLLSRRR
jgi:hypothetical protein